MDIRTYYINGRFDWQAVGPGLGEDDGLETAIIISLFSDRRADPGDTLPDGGTDRRGWWGDAYAEIEGDQIGSKLWLLSREKLLPETLRRAREYSEEALAWMIEDGIVDQVQVNAEAIDQKLLGIDVQIQRPDQAPERFRFNIYWQGGSNGL